MANIRDRDSWVHMNEPEKATEERRTYWYGWRWPKRNYHGLRPGQLTVNKATSYRWWIGRDNGHIVVGRSGFESYIVEKKPYLGGNYRGYYYTLEGLDTKKHLARTLRAVKQAN